MTLVAADNARIDSDGATLVEGLTFSTQGERVLLVGEWGPMIDLFAARAKVHSGSVRVVGLDVPTAVARGKVGLALSDPPLPPRWKAAEYLAASGRLAGAKRRDAALDAMGTLDRLGLSSLGSRKLATLSAIERRALMIAHASLGAPEVLVLDHPLTGLDDAAVSYLHALLDHCLEGRRWIAWTASLSTSSGTRRLVDRADEIVALESSTVVAQGAPADVLRTGSRYAVTVSRKAPDLVRVLSDLGVHVEVTRTDPRHEGAARLIVELGDDKTTDVVLDAALAAEAPVVELCPVSIGVSAEPPEPTGA